MEWKELCTAQQRELLKLHLKLVLEANEHINLTRIDDEDSAEVLHIEDSLVGLEEVNASPEGELCDLGSGAGYPGIPLAVLSGRQTTLMDAKLKKVEVLKSIIYQLGLSSQITCVAGQSEEIARDRKYAFAVVTARAVAKLSVLMELANPLLQERGHLICYKSHVTDEELDHAKSLTRTLGMKLISDRQATLSDGETFRRIIVFEKCGYPMIKLPRHVGFARKKPL